MDPLFPFEILRVSDIEKGLLDLDHLIQKIIHAVEVFRKAYLVKNGLNLSEPSYGHVHLTEE